MLLVAAAVDAADLERMLAARVAGHPLEGVLGWAEFCGRRVRVTPGVFVPRRRTELLARLAVAAAGPGSVVVELCCGAGAVAMVVAQDVPGARVHAADLDPAAVRCARVNLGTGQVFEGDLYDALPESLRGRVDVLVANAPYVPTGAIGLMPPEARVHEPALALDGGADGLEVQRRVVSAAPSWLAAGGRLLVETSARQAGATAELMTRAGLVPGVTEDPEIAATVATGAFPA